MIYLSDLLKATRGYLPHAPHLTEFSDFAYDSRRLKSGQLFIAIQTATGDGHDYIQEAISKGAGGILCQRINIPPSTVRQPQVGYSVTTIVVSNTMEALLDYSRFILRKYQPQVIGVTGSNGKTTTKDAIAMVLQNKFSVFKNFGSYNGRYGLPIALGQLQKKHQLAVLEMACDSFGEIDELVSLTNPKIGVVTSINPAHLANLGSVENIVLEKGRLIERLTPNGWAILNGDDKHILKMATKTQAQILKYGFTPQVAEHPQVVVQAMNITLTTKGTHFTVVYNKKHYRGQVALIGRHQLYAVLAAIAVGITYNISIEDALTALAKLPRLAGRLHPLAAKNGGLILDDTFNANPASMQAAIDTLNELKASAKVSHFSVAILGKMSDLGDYEITAHTNLGKYVADKVDRLIAVGEAGQLIAEGAVKTGLNPDFVSVTYTVTDTVKALLPYLTPQTIVLIKGSAEARLERVVAKLLAHPNCDQTKLARAESGWHKVKIGLPNRPTWVDIDLEKLGQNTRCLVELAHPARLMAILKADAYGHGAIKVARTALSNGAHWLGVATLEEALILRRVGITAPILVLGYLPAWQASDAVKHNISATVFSWPVLQAFSQAAQRLQSKANVHLKVDTGMGRLGIFPQDTVTFIKNINFPNLKVEGIFTHFGRADEVDLQSAKRQLTMFKKIITELETLNLRPPLVHAANTAALINLPEAHFDMVRVGIGLYGLNPSPTVPLPTPVQPILSFKTTIGQVKTLPPHSPVGYGATYYTKKQETIAIIPVGYADGFRRGPYTWPSVLVKGQRAPLIGRISMDQAAINISHIPNVRQGDEVVLIGCQGLEEITIEEVAASLGTINYEVISQILARVPRIT